VIGHFWPPRALREHCQCAAKDEQRRVVMALVESSLALSDLIVDSKLTFGP
jgi:hypothetical protein